MLALVPCEDSLPIVGGCGLAAVAGLVIWLRSAGRAWLVGAVLAAAYGAAALSADLFVVTDREALQAFFPRLARAAEAGDVETVLAAIDPALRPLRAEAEQALARARPTAILFTRMEIVVDPGSPSRTARADLIVRVTGRWLEGGVGTGLVGLDVRLRKEGERWLITAVEEVPVRPGSSRRGG